MSPAILLIAMTLHRPVGLVASIYNSTPANPVLACSTVEWESRYDWTAVHENPDGSHDWRYWQINDKWHNPYAYDKKKHIAAGAKIMTDDLKRAHGDVWTALHYWNHGKNYPPHVLAIYYKLKKALAAQELAARFNVDITPSHDINRVPTQLADWNILLFDNRKARKISTAA